jgi:prephenate dehydrogenase
MATKITLVGLGQIGSSVGLALRASGKDFNLTGFDTKSERAKQAKKSGAVNNIAATLPLAVRKADIVLLALPIDQVKETLEIISGNLKENAIVFDSSPAREEPTQWAAEYLPEHCHYVGFTPLISPLFLHEVEGQANANLFAHGLIAITASSGTNSMGMQTAAALAELLNATPLFADILEVDSHMGALHMVPQLLAGALSKTTTTQPGWQDGTKFAGRAYALSSSPIGSMDDPAGLAASAVMNKKNTLRVLDGIIAELQDMRTLIKNGDVEPLEALLAQAREGREAWWVSRRGARWAQEGMPGIDPELTKFKPFGRLLPERKRSKEGEEDHSKQNP